MDIYIVMIVLSYPFWKLVEIVAACVVHWNESRKWKRHCKRRRMEEVHEEPEEDLQEMLDDIEFPQQYALNYAEQFHLLNTGQVKAMKKNPNISMYSIRLRALTNLLDA